MSVLSGNDVVLVVAETVSDANFMKLDFMIVSCQFLWLIMRFTRIAVRTLINFELLNCMF